MRGKANYSGPTTGASSVGTLLSLCVTSILVGLIWDISWHMTIGRDTFWTPAHMAIYLGGAVPGMTCGLLAVRTTYFGGEEVRQRSVNVWGGYAPFGAWIVIWGAIAMITSAPFDDWWHSAYGLDVKIISPPHILLFLGMFGVIAGTLLFLLRDANGDAISTAGSAEEQRPRMVPSVLFLYVAGCLTGLLSFLFFSEGFPNKQHGGYFYFVSACVYPGVFIAVARASKLRWSATLCAFSYVTVIVVMAWILPRFSASPKLGPVLIPLDHMVPPYFPHLLFGPALVVDLLKGRIEKSSAAARALFIGLASLGFIFVLVVIQWNFSRFLIGPSADNVFFVGGQTFPYYSGALSRKSFFWEPLDLLIAPTLVRVGIAAIISGAIGAWVGAGLRKVVR